MRKNNRPSMKKIPPMLAQEVALAVDRWRRKSGLKQIQLLRTADISQGQLSRILAGRFTRSSAALERLCVAAGIDLDEILAKGSTTASWRTQLERELNRSWDGTPAHARELIRLLRLTTSLRMH
jgi:transcriptional regulator with XRE-family HTH domain